MHADDRLCHLKENQTKKKQHGPYWEEENKKYKHIAVFHLISGPIC